LLNENLLPVIENINEELSLLSQLAQGELSAFDKLYWHYERAVYKNIVQLVRDSALAEDILQEVFLSLWEKRDTVRQDVSIGGWLFVSSYNRSVNILKKKIREKAIADLIRDTYGEDDPEAIRIREMRLQELDAAIESLSGQKRKVFDLCKLRGYTYEEAAKDLNISKHTVKEYLSDAIRQIKEQMIHSGGIGILISFFYLYET
jgi:RNA polymerase sigma-70 factor (family 1)